jgi:hypothetical protein
MSRFGPTRSELKLRLAISLFGLASCSAYAGIGGIASLEIGSSAGRFSAVGHLVGAPPLAMEGPTHERRPDLSQLVLLALVFVAWAWLAGLPLLHPRRIGAASVNGGAAPETQGPQHAGVPDLRAGRDGGDAGRSADGLSLPLRALPV